MAKILVVHHSLQPVGGADAVAAWMLQALTDRHHVELLTWQSGTLESVNAYYGTSLRPTLARRNPPKWLRTLIDMCPLQLGLLKMSLVVREARRIAGEFDVVVCGSNEADFGERSIQYVHYPSRLRPRPIEDRRWYHYQAPLRFYYAASDYLARFDAARVTRARTLANSNWTAALVERLYGLTARVRVVPPPVRSDIEGRPWEEREDSFVCVGRIAPEKELERVIGIVHAVRRRVPTAHLHIIGSSGSAAYGKHIDRLARAHGDWVHIHRDASRDMLSELVGSHRYYIHGKREEHFGIAPAEAMAAGCIVFVPEGGGQVDIVGDEPRLRYSTEEEAAAKIIATMTSATAQAELRRHLTARRSYFSTDRFMNEIRETVDDVLAGLKAAS